MPISLVTDISGPLPYKRIRRSRTWSRRRFASIPRQKSCSVICILQVEVERVGLAESWRRGLCAVLGQSFLVSRIRISPATFACSTGYTSRAFRKVIPREFLRKDSPPEPSVPD